MRRFATCARFCWLPLPSAAPLLLALLMALWAKTVVAVDLPHTDGDDFCASCHVPHSAPAGQLTAVNGNANLCLGCHISGGAATNKPFSDLDQALPWPGLPTGTNAAGNSHRWDSGPAGHFSFLGGASTNSLGTLISSGVFTGAVAKTYTLTITTAGNSGTARFGWTATSPGGGGGTNILSGTNIALNEGVSVTFLNSTNTNSLSFQLNDRWNLYVRTDLRMPTNTALLARITNSLIMCSTCHDEHSQRREPFDPSAPSYGPPSMGVGRHYMRYTNNLNQMCVDCHLSRNVTNSVAGSHPVGLMITNATIRMPTNLPLDKTVGAVRCMTCHQLHYAPTSDGTLLRMTNRVALCMDCHTRPDATATHLSTTNNNVLWPGGQYGTTFPQNTNLTERGSCMNCHQAHGWPDNSNPSQDYSKLLVERKENLCFTCHDGSPASNQTNDFAGTNWVILAVGLNSNTNLNTHHDVRTNDQARSGAVMTCVNCHDPHRDKATAKIVADPDPTDGRVPAAGQTWTGSDYLSEWCLDCHDGSLPPTITAPATQLANIRYYYATEPHGSGNGRPGLKTGYGWAQNDVLPCTACHDPGHGTSNFFHLKTTVYSKSGTTAIPSDGGSTTVTVTNNNVTDKNVNGYYFCNTCHTGSMGNTRKNCFECHYHGSGKL